VDACVSTWTAAIGRWCVGDIAIRGITAIATATIMRGMLMMKSVIVVCNGWSGPRCASALSLMIVKVLLIVTLR
jgi:hypothetical protein